MIRIAIVEDEDREADIVSRFLDRFGREMGEELVSVRYTDGYDIADKYTGGFDVILMDIEMGLMDGMEAAEHIRKSDEQVVIIFITNMAQYAIRGYSVNALDYILKPISYTAFSQTLKKALRQIQKTEESYITISLRDGIEKLRVRDVCWIQSRGHRLTFHTREGEYETTVYSMKEMESRLAGEGFMRCSSGTLVNLRYVSGIRSGSVEVDGVLLTVSRGRKTEFMDALVSYMTR